ncbi:MAG: putative polymerase subfamily sigma factor [Ilumatobacteraceae bacterium]|nr:putative polymerase subfamily sigma factor [Ilumatobacteraceae bacterium]
MVRDSLNGTGSFEQFAVDADLQLRRALVARFGVDVGHDVANDAMAYAWEHRDEVCAASNPLGLLYRVGQSSARRYLRWNRRVDLPAEEAFGDQPFEPGLAPALAAMRAEHRLAVVLIHGYGWSYAETASMLNVPVSTVRNWATRGLDRLRRLLKETT